MDSPFNSLSHFVLYIRLILETAYLPQKTARMDCRNAVVLKTHHWTCQNAWHHAEQWICTYNTTFPNTRLIAHHNALSNKKHLISLLSTVFSYLTIYMRFTSRLLHVFQKKNWIFWFILLFWGDIAVNVHSHVLHVSLRRLWFQVAFA